LHLVVLPSESVILKWSLILIPLQYETELWGLMA
jgi:hypothetical protein